MDLSERELELAEQSAGIQVGAAVEAARAALVGAGAEDCKDCGGEIPKARREAIPSATRCVHCQAINDRDVQLHRGRPMARLVQPGRAKK